jgi:ubiquinone biosynthesis protein
MKISSPDLQHLEANLRGLGMAVFGGLMASALTLGGMYFVARYEWEVSGVPVLPAVAFLSAGVLSGIAFSWYLFGGRRRKLSLGWLFGRRRRSS